MNNKMGNERVFNTIQYRVFHDFQYVSSKHMHVRTISKMLLIIGLLHTHSYLILHIYTCIIVYVYIYIYKGPICMGGDLGGIGGTAPKRFEVGRPMHPSPQYFEK